MKIPLEFIEMLNNIDKDPSPENLSPLITMFDTDINECHSKIGYINDKITYLRTQLPRKQKQLDWNINERLPIFTKKLERLTTMKEHYEVKYGNE